MAAPKFKNRYTNSSPHLGWKPTPPERLAKIPRFESYVKTLSAGVLPAEWDYSDKALASFLTMLGNSQQGDCSIAAVLKQVGLASANRPDPKELVSNDREALAQYPVICGAGDSGCYIPDVLDYWRDHGLVVNGQLTKILGYVAVDVNNPLLVAKALYLSVSLHAGLMITQKQYEGAAPDAVWDADNSPLVGGHSIPLAGRKNQGWRMGTWAMKCFITQAALAARRAQTELYAVIDEQWFGQSGLNSFGVDAAKLQADLATIAGGGDVPIPDPTPPNPPTPVPPTPGGGGSLTATGTVDFFGNKLPVELAGTVASASAAGKGSILDIFGDFAAILAAFRAKDWVAVASAVMKLLADLGIVLSAAELDQLVANLKTAHELAPLDHSETSVP